LLVRHEKAFLDYGDYVGPASWPST
jgi:hypothetical protein